MKFSTALLTAVFAAVSFVSAAPLERRAGTGTKKAMGKTKLDASGAVYFLTNEPDVNRIIAASINADGSLNLDNAIETGGRGSHGKSNGPDALFSQGAVKASKKGKVLAAVNAGSNTVALFSINPKEPTDINPIGDVVSSEGEFPISVAFNSNGDRFCVLNGGLVNGVNCYRIDKKLGPIAIVNGLRLLTNDLQTSTPPEGPANTASHIVFSEDDQQLIVSVKGTPDKAGFFAVWGVNGDGSLTADFKKVAPAKGGLLPFGMSVIPGKNAVLATDAGVGFDIVDLKDTSKNSVVKIDGQVATCWATHSQATGNFYLTDIGTAIVTEVHVDDNLKGSVVAGFPLTPGSALLDLDIATVNGKDFIYVLAANATSIDVLSIDSPGLALRQTALNLVGPTKAAGITINANNLQGLTTFAP
ncbi:hypothetical protein L226DRAFT_463342 [Lentinus tigrinus ALCF2SS1-7]|uniref:Isomerase YbhE n=1 Tax=Lentinus tigrinus ALCF2SS1-6 TaxID=1328759 RepID=A0A5C2S861_9APHY|nr:hypothetical protein L227DRAFT_611467 [Lentinus tigrinus ALCF2SS1-6]RPD74780.1 hypothetical protein L226DRAFT_463342 [Lentinus tigrinus ALCF2SS1-7]